MGKAQGKAQGKAYAYIRVSTHEQAVEGVSLAAQEASIRAYAAMRGLELAGIYRDNGISAGKPLETREGGAAMLADLRKGGAAHVIVTRLDRAFRDTVDALQNVKAWDKGSVSFHVVDLGGAAMDTGSATGRFFLSILASLGELERGLIGERTASALAHKKAHHESYSPTPLGYRVEDGRLHADAQEMDTVKRISAMRDNGDSYHTIARTLNEAGVKTKRGGRWHASTVRYIVKNNLYEGAA